MIINRDGTIGDRVVIGDKTVIDKETVILADVIIGMSVTIGPNSLITLRRNRRGPPSTLPRIDRERLLSGLAGNSA